ASKERRRGHEREDEPRTLVGGGGEYHQPNRKPAEEEPLEPACFQVGRWVFQQAPERQEAGDAPGKHMRQKRQRRLPELDADAFALGAPDGVADEFALNELVDKRLAHFAVSEPEPAAANHGEESQAEPVRAA